MKGNTTKVHPHSGDSAKASIPGPSNTTYSGAVVGTAPLEMCIRDSTYICTIFSFTCEAANAQDRTGNEEYVLILNSYNESSPWSNSITCLLYTSIFTDWLQILLDRIFIQIRHHTCIRKSGCRYIKYRSDAIDVYKRQ